MIVNDKNGIYHLIQKLQNNLQIFTSSKVSWNIMKL